MPYPVGNVWCIGDSKTYGVTDAPGSCGARDPMYTTFLSSSGGALVGTLTGGANGLGGNLTPCTISGLALNGEGHSGIYCQDVTAGAAGWYATIAVVPAAAILYIGTNDLIAIATATPTFNIDRLYTDFATCVSTVRALNATTALFVCNLDLMPSLLSSPAASSALFALNAFIGALVKQYQRQGSKTYLIDLASASLTYNAGGIHQDIAGYAATSARIVAAMKTLRPAG